MSFQLELTRRQLDKRLVPFRSLELKGPPARGWIRAIRDSLGMTAAQLASRLGVTQPTVTGIERSEAGRSITLDTLDRAAHALGCRLVYALVPEQNLDTMVQTRAREMARKKLSHLDHTMRLEDQAVEADEANRQLERATEYLLTHKRSGLWQEE